jgi:hypothetical protein
MLLWSGSLTTPPGISTSLIGDAPVWHDRDWISETIGECNIILLRLLRDICTRKVFFGGLRHVPARALSAPFVTRGLFGYASGHCQLNWQVVKRLPLEEYLIGL